MDDGFSGVSFEREGLQTMLREVEAGNVATVITKDLSRLGRNYLKTGELIEIIFPEYDVRYIAINDGVDTAREDNEFTPLRNVKLTKSLPKTAEIKWKPPFLCHIFAFVKTDRDIVKSLSFLIEHLNHIYLCTIFGLCILISHLY